MKNNQERVKRINSLEVRKITLDLACLVSLIILGTIFVLSVEKVSVAGMFFSFGLFVATLWALIKWNRSWSKEIRQLKK